MAAKNFLWVSLTAVVASNVGVKLCICGDFNVIRSTEEWKSRRVGL